MYHILIDHITINKNKSHIYINIINQNSSFYHIIPISYHIILKKKIGIKFEIHDTTFYIILKILK